MSVSKFEQPDFTAQDAASYKAAIDNSIATLAETANQFAPTEMATVGMGIQIEAGLLMDGTVIAAQNLTGIGAPSANPRIDRVYFNFNSRSYHRITGTEAVTPVPPNYPAAVLPICQIVYYVGQTTIVNADIIDERCFVVSPIGQMKDAYTTIYDPDHLNRIIIGRPSVDHRIILKTHTADAGSKVVIQNSAGTTVCTIDGAGNIVAAGSITPNGTP